MKKLLIAIALMVMGGATAEACTFEPGKMTCEVQASLDAGTATWADSNDGSSQLSAWSIVGLSGATTTNGVIYINLSNSDTTRTVDIYSDAARTAKIATGTRTGNGRLTFTQSNSSGVSGSVTVAYTTDDTDITLTSSYTGVNGYIYTPYNTFDDSAAFLRFQNVRVPKNATITSAYLSFTPYATTSSSGTVKVSLISEVDCAAYTASGSTHPYARTLGSYVTGSYGAWTKDVRDGGTAVDIASLINEWQALAGWDYGMDIGLKVAKYGYSANKTAYSFYNVTSTKVPQLIINFTGGDPLIQDVLMADPRTRTKQYLYIWVANMSETDKIKVTLDGSATPATLPGSYTVNGENRVLVDYTGMSAGSHTLRAVVTNAAGTEYATSAWTKTFTTTHSGYPAVGIDENNSLCLRDPGGASCTLYFPIWGWIWDVSRYYDYYNNRPQSESGYTGTFGAFTAALNSIGILGYTDDAPLPSVLRTHLTYMGMTPAGNIAGRTLLGVAPGKGSYENVRRDWYYFAGDYKLAPMATYNDTPNGHYYKCTKAGLAAYSSHLAVGTPATTVYSTGINYKIGATWYHIEATHNVLPAGTIPQNKYGLYELFADTSQNITITAAAGNATGYDTEALAIAAHPALPENSVSMGYVTVRSTAAGGFVAGTTLLSATTTTDTYYSVVLTPASPAEPPQWCATSACVAHDGNSEWTEQGEYVGGISGMIATNNTDCTETLTLGTAPGSAWNVSDVITGATSGATCTITAVTDTKHYKISGRSGEFTMDETLSNQLGVTANQTDWYPQVGTDPINCGYARQLKDHANLMAWTWEDEPNLGGVSIAKLAPYMRTNYEAVKDVDTNHPQESGYVGYAFMPGSNEVALVKTYQYLTNGDQFPDAVTGEPIKTWLQDMTCADSFPYGFNYQDGSLYTLLGAKITLESTMAANDNSYAWNYGLAMNLGVVAPSELRATSATLTSCADAVDHPTADQLKNELWLRVIHGASGMAYFVFGCTPESYQNSTALDFKNAIETGSPALGQVILQEKSSKYTPVTISVASPGTGYITAPTNYATVTAGDDGRVDYMVREYGGKTYVFAARLLKRKITGSTTYTGEVNADCSEMCTPGDTYGAWPDAVNTDATKKSATIPVTDLAAGTTVRVLFEDRNISSGDGTITDDFKNYDVHIYEYVPPAGEDTTAPTVNTFTIPETSSSLTVTINSFTCSDAVGVTGYCATDDNSTTDCPETWPSTAPADITLSAGEGARTVYGWCKDAAGNVSSKEDGVSTDAVTIDTSADYIVTVTKAGEGAGTVTSSPAGIDCGLTCAADFAGTTEVTLTATADGGNAFAGWSGGTGDAAACTGTDTCVLTVSEASGVTATFTPLEYDLLITYPTDGTVITEANAGVDCGDDSYYCSYKIPSSAPTLSFTATCASGYVTPVFSGDCSGSTCTLTMNALHSISASCTATTTTITTSGNGTVTEDVSGTVSTLTPVAEACNMFSSWSGTDAADCAGETICTLDRSSANKEVTANFVQSGCTGLGSGGGVGLGSGGGVGLGN